jgi:hypothetical protein
VEWRARGVERWARGVGELVKIGGLRAKGVVSATPRGLEGDSSGGVGEALACVGDPKAAFVGEVADGGRFFADVAAHGVPVVRPPRGF